jgi:NAD(P)-dependent dehydrogenase (short-subunit alcohol dehydrogenase family)
MMVNGDLFNLEGKTALVTGGVGLLGSEYAWTLAHHGAHVILVDINQEACTAKARVLEEQSGRKMLGIKTDITSQPEVREMVARVGQEFGTVDILVNNAAMVAPADARGSSFSEFHDYPLELWEKSLQVNMTGLLLCCQEVIKLMLKNYTPGSIINVSSIYGVVAPDQALYESITDGARTFKKPVDYSATKSAVLNFTRYLAAYYGKDGIRVNTLTPGGVWDNQSPEFEQEYRRRTPLGRMARPDDYNGAILFLASDASSYMTGANLVVDGGWTCW